MDVSENGGFSPEIIHFHRVFHYFHHPFWGFFPLFLETSKNSLLQALPPTKNTYLDVHLEVRING